MPTCAALCRLAACLGVLAFFAGCPRTPTSSPAPPTAGESRETHLRLAIVDDTALGEAIAREWRSRTEGELEVRNISLAQLLEASRLPADAVIYPAGFVGSLVERGLVVPFDDQALASEEFDRRDIFDQVRLREMSYGNRTVAVPLGSPQLLLVYRRDVFEKLGIAPPADWKAYQAAVERLAASGAEGLPSQATAEPLAPGWAGQLLLARAAAYVSHRNQLSPLFHYTSGDPLIASPPFERALEELVAANKGSADKRLDPPAAANEVVTGRTAMALGWIAPPGQEASQQSADGANVGFALLPGAAEAYGFAQQAWEKRQPDEDQHVSLLSGSGRLASVSATAHNTPAAQDFLAWLAGKEVSAAVAPVSTATTLFRGAHLAQPQGWTSGLGEAPARAYGEAVQSAASRNRYVSLRLPGRERYLQALDEAVWAAVGGETSPAEALAAAAEKWRAITSELGLKEQVAALRRSLGMEGLERP